MKHQLNAKRIKRHMLRTYEFWQIDERFLVIAPDQKIREIEGLEKVPESDVGYLAYAYLDETMRVAFLGACDPEDDTYAWFDEERVFVAPADLMPNVLVRPVKPTRELTSHPFVASVLAEHAQDALRRSTLALRSLDPLRDPRRPMVLTACFIRDERRRSKEYKEMAGDYEAAYRKAVEAAGADADEDDIDVQGAEKPEVGEELVNFIPIRDLVPANHNSWRATLMRNLPGTKRARREEDVGIAMVTLDVGEDEQATMLQIDLDLPVEPSDIHVALSKPKRLPWRLAYDLKCSSCDYRHTFYLGRHGEDSLLFGEILDTIREGKVDPLILIELVQRDDGELDFSRELYRCRSCGYLDVKHRLRLTTPDERTIPETYNCPSCGERMAFMKRNHIASIDCPECREPLRLMNEKIWAGVPDAQIPEEADEA